MTNDIFCVGLTRTELQTLGVLLPITFRIIPVSSEALDHAAVVRVIDQARCIILNPKRLSVDLLDDFLRGQDYQRWNNAPVPIISCRSIRSFRLICTSVSTGIEILR